MYGQVPRLYRWPRRQMMIATNISGRTIRTVQSWREESAQFHFLKRKLVRSQCRTGMRNVERGAMRSFPFVSCFRKQRDRCAVDVPPKNHVALVTSQECKLFDRRPSFGRDGVTAKKYHVIRPLIICSGKQRREKRGGGRGRVDTFRTPVEYLAATDAVFVNYPWNSLHPSNSFIYTCNVTSDIPDCTFDHSQSAIRSIIYSFKKKRKKLLIYSSSLVLKNDGKEHFLGQFYLTVKQK